MALCKLHAIVSCCAAHLSFTQESVRRECNQAWFDNLPRLNEDQLLRELTTLFQTVSVSQMATLYKISVRRSKAAVLAVGDVMLYRKLQLEQRLPRLRRHYNYIVGHQPRILRQLQEEPVMSGEATDDEDSDNVNANRGDNSPQISQREPEENIAEQMKIDRQMRAAVDYVFAEGQQHQQQRQEAEQQQEQTQSQQVQQHQHQQQQQQQWQEVEQQQEQTQSQQVQQHQHQQ